MDFNALQRKLFELDPTDPADDLAKLREQAGAAPVAAQPAINYLSESADIPPGSLQMDGDYSLLEFAALAGVKPPVTEFKHGWDNYNNLSALKGGGSAEPITPKQAKPAPADSKPVAQSALHPKLVSKLEPHAEKLETIYRSAKLRAKFEKFLNTLVPAQPSASPNRESIKETLYRALAEYDKGQK